MKDVIGAPDGPGSHPADQAQEGLGAPRVDPSREEVFADRFGDAATRLKWYLPDQLRWLDDNRDAGYMPCGQLVGITLRQCADIMESQQHRIMATRRVIERGHARIVGGEKVPELSLRNGEKCDHERFGFEDCVSCYDEALMEALTSDSDTHPQGGDAERGSVHG